MGVFGGGGSGNSHMISLKQKKTPILQSLKQKKTPISKIDKGTSQRATEMSHGEKLHIPKKKKGNFRIFQNFEF